MGDIPVAYFTRISENYEEVVAPFLFFKISGVGNSICYNKPYIY